MISVFAKLLINWAVVFCSSQLALSDRYFSLSEKSSLSNENFSYNTNNLTLTTEHASKQERHPDSEVEDKFLSKSNTIIRTGESRALGAKYLNETRLSSHHQCLIWCLETFSCNAAVYEEKNMQSCYLFDCGSPVRPLCKFTAHAFFTSSVLKVTQHSYELSQWGKEVQLEREQKQNPSAPVESSTTTAVSSTTTTATQKENACHHYQFQCVNNSECIAIYNVCDGIPQCPDGSDESPDIQCPTKGGGENKMGVNQVNRKMSIIPSVTSKTPPKQVVSQILPSDSYLDVPQYQKPVTGQKDFPHKEDPREEWPNPFLSSQMPKAPYKHNMDESDGLGSPFVHKHSQFLSATDPHVHDLNRWASDYDPYAHASSLENPYERVDADYEPLKNYADFVYWPNQDASYTADEFPQPHVQKIMNYPAKESINQYPESKLSMRKHLANSPPDSEEYQMQMYPPSNPYLRMEDSAQPRLPSYPDVKLKANNMYGNDDLIRASIINQLPKKSSLFDNQQMHHPSDLKLPDKDSTYQLSRATSTPQSTSDNSLIVVKPTSHTKSIQRTVLDFKMSVAQLYESKSTHTHEANSAVVALVLGILVFVLLIILLACRMKTLRRRLSRKGKSLTHDADYLVNGMYL